MRDLGATAFTNVANMEKTTKTYRLGPKGLKKLFQTLQMKPKKLLWILKTI